MFSFSKTLLEKDDRKNILASPLTASVGDLKDLPPALFVVAEADVIRNEAEDYARKLLQTKVPVYCSRILGVLDDFIADPALFS